MRWNSAAWSARRPSPCWRAWPARWPIRPPCLMRCCTGAAASPSSPRSCWRWCARRSNRSGRRRSWWRRLRASRSSTTGKRRTCRCTCARSVTACCRGRRASAGGCWAWCRLSRSRVASPPIPAPSRCNCGSRAWSCPVRASCRSPTQSTRRCSPPIGCAANCRSCARPSMAKRSAPGKRPRHRSAPAT